MDNNPVDSAPKPDPYFWPYAVLIGSCFAAVIIAGLIMEAFAARGRAHLQDELDHGSSNAKSSILEYPGGPDDGSATAILEMLPLERPPASPPADPPTEDLCGRVVDLHAPKYLKLCADRSPPLQGDDCDQFLYEALCASDTTVSPDFALPPGCPGE